MKHINTTSEEEKKAKDTYKTADSGLAIEADGKLEDVVWQLLGVLKEIDEKTLEASKLKAIIMNAMKSGAALKNKDGKLLCSWTVGGVTSSTDYVALLKKYNVSEKDIKAFTVKKTGSRRFSLEID